jgi:hypothetical protein
VTRSASEGQIRDAGGSRHAPSAPPVACIEESQPFVVDRSGPFAARSGLKANIKSFLGAMLRTVRARL